MKKLLENGWMIFGFVATFAYGGLVFAFNEYEQGNVFSVFPSLPLNEKGDALSGLFAPLAFLWLFVATMIQSQELAAQRKEIECNRKVMQEQSDAAKDQAAFSKAQTDAMEQQTRLLVQQVGIAQKSAERTHTMALFEKRIEIYNQLVNWPGCEITKDNLTDDKISDLIALADKAEFVFDDDVVRWIYKLSRHASDIWQGNRTITTVDPERIDHEHYNSEREQVAGAIENDLALLRLALAGPEMGFIFRKYLNLRETYR
jgi:hypothetical protein